MKISMNQLRRIIVEEVKKARLSEDEGRDRRLQIFAPYAKKLTNEEQKKKFNDAIEKLVDQDYLEDAQAAINSANGNKDKAKVKIENDVIAVFVPDLDITNYNDEQVIAALSEAIYDSLND